MLLAGFAACCSTVFAQDSLRLRSRDVRFRDTPNLLQEKAITAGKAPRVLVLDGPISPERRAELSQAGVKVKSFLEGNAFLADIPAGSPASLKRLGFVQNITDFKPEWKIAPGLAAKITPRNFKDAARQQLSKRGKLALIISLTPGADLNLVRTQISALPGSQLFRIENAGGDQLAVVALPANQIAALSQIPGVHFIDEFPEFEDRNSTARWIIQSNVSNYTPLYTVGLTGLGQIVGVIEATTKLDINHCAFVDPINPIGPNHRKIVSLSSSLSVGVHATHVTDSAAGDAGNDSDTRGVAYGSKIAFATGLTLNESAIYNLFTLNYNAGAFVHNNSWGNKFTNAYDVTCRAVDNFSWLNSACLLTYATSESGPLTNPENAKNILAVVACGDTPNQNVVTNGGLGPTTDGRRKPEIAAPGSNIVSANPNTGCGTTTASGTSMATPMVTGMAAIIRQYFTGGSYPTGIANPSNAFNPSGALLKAMLLNSAVRMTSQTEYPDDTAGWGRLLADRAVYLPGDTRTLLVRDQFNNATGALSTGQTRYVRFVVTPGSEDLRATLAFHDAPGDVASLAPVVNDLNLTVIAPGRIDYLGNAFTGGWSTTGGSPDPLNNVEMGMFQTPTPGVWFAKITAPAVNVGTQGYGLVLTGNVAEATCICDLNVDGLVDDADFSMFIVSYDLFDDPLGDFNNDGVTDDADFSIFVGAYDQLLCS